MTVKVPRPDYTMAVGYVRVSTEEQRNGPEAQKKAIEDWADRAEVTVVCIYYDLGVSGAAQLDQRPGLSGALLDPCGAGLFLVAKRDRLARDPWVALSVDRRLAKRQVRIISCDGTGNGDSPADEFMRAVIDGAAAFERRMIADRTKAALAAKKDRGECVGAVPYGYRREGKTLVPVTAEMEIVRRARELHAAGCSLREIANILFAQGYTARSTRPLHPNQIKRMLVQPDHGKIPLRVPA